jgi:hypothetical protein
MLVKGEVFIVENVMVGNPEKKLKQSHHAWKLSFMASTTIVKANCDSIPERNFDFIDFAEILKVFNDRYLLGINLFIFYFIFY